MISVTVMFPAYRDKSGGHWVCAQTEEAGEHGLVLKYKPWSLSLRPVPAQGSGLRPRRSYKTSGASDMAGWNNMVLYDRESPGGDCVPRMALHGRVLGDL